MEIKLTENIKIEMNLPIKKVESFQYSWKPDCHAQLQLIGYIDVTIPWNPILCYDSYVKLWNVKGEKIQILFQGCITGMEINSAGGIDQVFLKVTSASSQLDRQNFSSSFQNPKMTYGEAVRQSVQNEGGQVIRNQESDKKIGYPVIRDEETAWQFAERMAENLGISIIPDIETGRPNLWFGMRIGKEVTSLSEDEYSILLRPIGNKIGTRIQVKGQDFYKIGDFMTYMGKKIVITEVDGQFKQGELIFLYTLVDMPIREKSCNSSYPAGLGYWGTIIDVKEESIRLALDIDHGEDTGEYYYPWCPITGNSLYAVPEVGAKALLYFNRENFQDGMVVHCMNQKPENTRNYQSRAFNIQNGDTITMFEETVNILKGKNHSLSLSDYSISAGTVNKLKILAKKKIQLKADDSSIETPEDLDIFQG